MRRRQAGMTAYGCEWGLNYRRKLKYKSNSDIFGLFILSWSEGHKMFFDASPHRNKFSFYWQMNKYYKYWKNEMIWLIKMVMNGLSDKKVRMLMTWHYALRAHIQFILLLLKIVNNKFFTIIHPFISSCLTRKLTTKPNHKSDLLLISSCT